MFQGGIFSSNHVCRARSAKYLWILVFFLLLSRMREDEAEESDLEMKTSGPMMSTENAAARFILIL